MVAKVATFLGSARAPACRVRRPRRTHPRCQTKRREPCQPKAKRPCAVAADVRRRTHPNRDRRIPLSSRWP
jgi:hypothetical protein